MFSVYVLCATAESPPRYVGITSGSLRRRLSGHLRLARAGRKLHVSCWLRSLDKRPTIEAVETHEKFVDACSAEQFYIAYLRFLGFNLANHTNGGEGTPGLVSNKRGTTLSAETRKKISKTLQGHSYNKGIPKSLAHRKKLSAVKAGKKLSAAHAENISIAYRARGATPPSWAGKKRTAKTREKMRTSARTPARPVVETTTATAYPSVKAAARAIGVSAVNILRALSRPSGKTCGYHFVTGEL